MLDVFMRASCVVKINLPKNITGLNTLAVLDTGRAEKWLAVIVKINCLLMQ